MKQPIFLMIGVPGVGKSWVMDRVGDAYERVRHDDFIEATTIPTLHYVRELLRMWAISKKPILAEAPFSVSSIKDPLERAGAEIRHLILIEDPQILAERYEKDPNRDGKPLPKGHLTRMETYRRRAEEYNAFVGNSSEVLEYLVTQASQRQGK